MVMNDRMMANQMQAAAAMAAPVIQLRDNSSQPAKTDKGESFQDLMDKAKDQQVEAPKKEEAAETREPAQKVESPRKVTVTRNEDGSETQSVQLAAQEAAMLAAGYAQMSPPQEDGIAWLAMPVEESGENLAAPMDAVQDQRALFLDNEWVVEPTPEVAVALEEVLQEHNDPTLADSILSELERKIQNAVLKPQTDTAADAGDEVDPADYAGASPRYFHAVERSSKEEDDSSGLARMMMSSEEKLFQDVDGTPIKVGEPFELDTRDADMDVQLADAIRSAAIQDLRQLEVQLSPENLGTVTIKLTQTSDGVLSVIMHTSNAKAAALLSEHLDGLSQALQSFSQGQEIRVAVQYNEESQQSQYQQADPDGHNGQQRQQEHHPEEQESGEDFVQRLRLGLVGVEDEV